MAGMAGQQFTSIVMCGNAITVYSQTLSLAYGAVSAGALAHLTAIIAMINHFCPGIQGEGRLGIGQSKSERNRA
jgi:hypothetical protein